MKRPIVHAVLIITTLLAATSLFAVLTASAQNGAPDGSLIYASTCIACHQADGAGVPGAFPPLAGHIKDLFAAEGGPRYVASVVLFGLQGPISVRGEAFNGIMPSFFSFSDAEIAAVIDYVMRAFGAEESAAEDYLPLTEADVAAARRGGLSPELVHQRRPALADEIDEEVTELELASFTLEQAEGARATYDRLCEECHGSDLTGGLIGGPPLAGFVFRQKWGGRPLAPLFQFMATQMPQGSPGSLSAQRYADLLALILSQNGHEPGTEPLAPDLDRLSRLTVRSN